MRIALFDAKPYDRKYFSPDSEKYGYEIGYIEPSLSKNTAILARGYDVVCPFVDCTVDRDTIDILKAEGINLIAMRSAGFNNVDYRYAAEKGIPVVRVPAYSPYAVAEHSFALLLALVRKLTHAYVRTREFNFSLRVAIDIAKGFGMKVLVYDPFAGDIEGTEKASLERIMSEADIISLYCPLTESNRHMINKDTLSLMKPSAIVINTSRGALIDSNALLEALKDRKIGGAALDVYEEEAGVFYQDQSSEGIEDDTLARLISMPNVIITSHQGYLTDDALSAISATTMENIKAFEEGRELVNQVV